MPSALVDARYSRAAESDADGYAIKALTANHVSTRPTADFFARMGRTDTTGNRTVDSAFSWLSSHPVSAARRDRFLAADEQVVDPRPVMTAADWNAIKGMCAKTPKAATNKPDQSKR